MSPGHLRRELPIAAVSLLLPVAAVVVAAVLLRPPREADGAPRRAPDGVHEAGAIPAAAAVPGQ
jgi:hypothetical protein